MSPKRKIYTSLTVFGLLALLFALLIVYPIFKGIKRNSEELLLQKNNLISLLEEIKNLENSEELYLANQSNLEKIDKLFIDREIPIEFITFLESIAADSQLSIDVFPVVTEKKETGLWTSLSFQITAIGSSPNFLKFLEKLENNPYLIEVLNLNLKRLAPREGAVSSDINASFAIKVFAQ